MPDLKVLEGSLCPLTLKIPIWYHPVLFLPEPSKFKSNLFPQLESPQPKLLWTNSIFLYIVLYKNLLRSYNQYELLRFSLFLHSRLITKRGIYHRFAIQF